MSSHNQKKDNNQSKNNKQPDVQENQTAWKKSDNQKVKKKHSPRPVGRADKETGSQATQQHGGDNVGEQGCMNGKLESKLAINY